MLEGRRCLLGFVFISLVHEMLFQGIFWLMVGAASALPDRKAIAL
ncbi:hypothetical protein [Georgfuchsia toluolica]|nr:hypothetical protein [Georgfuchsia toluolica]